MSELDRINTVKQATGDEAAFDFAKRTMTTYRKAVLHSAKRGISKPHFASAQVWRKTFIESYLELKRYVIANGPDAHLTPAERQAKVEAAKLAHAREEARIRTLKVLENVHALMQSRIEKVMVLKRVGTNDPLWPVDMDMAEAEGRQYAFLKYSIAVHELNDKQAMVTAPWLIGAVCGNYNMYGMSGEPDMKSCIFDLILRALIIGSQTKKI